MNAENILVLTPREIASLLTVDDCIIAIEQAFRLLGEGKAGPPVVLSIHLPGGGFHVKAGVLDLGRQYFAAKVNGNFPENPARFALPTIQGVIVVCDAEKGGPLAVMDSREITSLRTAAATEVIREDPVRRGLLFAGTETGIYVSLDDGARWQSLQLNLPRSSVRDIAIHESDLIVATHGRAFWVLDDISPLRQLSDQVRGASAHLFTPEPAVRFAGGRDERPATGENPFPGVAVTYYLKDKPAPQGEVTRTEERRVGKGVKVKR